jgi:hypothetical protein
MFFGQARRRINGEFFSMPFRPLDEAQAVIGAHRTSLVGIVDECHRDFIRVCGSLLHTLEGGTKAGIVRDLIVGKLRAWADATPGVQFFREGNLSWVGFHNNWIARVKMLDDRFHVGVSPTEASDQYDRNSVPESVRGTLLEGQEATLLYLGWRTTENAPLTPEVALVCNNQYGEIGWVWPLRGDEPPPGLPFPVVDAPDAPDTGDEGQKRIRVRAGKIAKEI